MNYQGDIVLGDTIDLKFTTVNSTGIPTTLAGSPVVAAYVGNDTAEITAGVTLSVDFDARAGMHNVRIVASSGNGFAASSDVTLVLTAGTVGGSSVVGYVVGSFSIAKRPVTLTAGERTTLSGVVWGVLTSALTTAGSVGKLLVDNINATIASRSTYAGGDTAGTTTLLSRIASALTITSGKVDVNDKTGFSLTAAYDPAKTSAQAGSEMTLTSAYDAAKTAATQASVNSLDDFVDTEVNAIKIVTDKLDTALEADAGVWRYTVNSLENAPTSEGGSGGFDWTLSEREQIRHRLGIDGVTNLPATVPSLASQVSVSAIESVSDKLDTMLQADGAVFQYTANALELAPVGANGGNGGEPPSEDSPCAQNPAQTRGPTTQPYPPEAGAAAARAPTKVRVRTW